MKTKIVVYSVTDDEYLNAQIYNSHYSQRINLFEFKSHFDVVMTNESYEGISIGQNIVFELVNDIFGFEFPVSIGNVYNIDDAV